MAEIKKSQSASTHSAENGKLAKDAKAEKFVRLANVRVNRLIKVAGLVANLGNQANYISSPEQRDRIMSAVNKAADMIHERFAGAIKADDDFRL